MVMTGYNCYSYFDDSRVSSEEKAILAVKEAFSSLSVRALPVPKTKI